MSAPEIAEDDGRRLLEVARAAVAARLAGEAATKPDAVPPTLSRKSGAFVSIHASDGGLRGCVGYVEPLYPLVEAVARAAVLAATEDHRFESLRADELADVAFDVSVLGPPSAIAADDVEVGRHGLVAEGRGRRGLLLPQVPVEHGWDRETFLQHTCLKAGLAPDAWRADDIHLLGFEARVFREGEGDRD